MRAFRLALTTVVAFTLCAVVARGDSSVRMVRLSLVVGAVQVNLPDGRGWRPALLNLPLVQGEQVRTLASGRAEIQFEGGSTLRLIPDSSVSLTRMLLSDSGVFRTSARLDAGTAFVSLRKSDAKDFKLLLPDGSTLQPDGGASFRASAADAVLVFNGKLQRQAPGQAAQKLALVGQFKPDPWTKWSQDRDHYYANAFHEGVNNDDATTLVNWWGNQGTHMPKYSGTGLSYTGDASCPWTQSSGDYKGWCWTDARGWFLPATPPQVKPNAAQTASDVSQTNGVLGSSLQSGAGLQPVANNCVNAVFTQYGWFTCGVPYIDPALRSFAYGPGYTAGYMPLAMTSAVVSRSAHRGMHPSRPTGAGGGAIARIHRLGPPPAPHVAAAANAPAFHAAHNASGGGIASRAMATGSGRNIASTAAVGGAAHASVLSRGGGAANSPRTTATHVVH